MSRSTTHNLQPATNHDGLSRRLAILAAKQAIRPALEPALQADYQQFAAADLSASAVQAKLMSTASYRNWSCASRYLQDRMWQVLAEQVDQDYKRIKRDADEATASPAGSLSLDLPSAMPAYQLQSTLHGQPGGYMLQRDAADLAAGILYEAGGNLFALGIGMGRRDSKAERLIKYVRETWPRLTTKRILEMGCSAGAQSTDYPVAFPDAECHAIDLSPGLLRYAHARAEALSSPVHFHQMDAGNTTFPDAHFDLIVSHNLFHEVAADHAPAILRESHRLLKPGGVCIHQDLPIQTERLKGFQRFVADWQHENNDEPFWHDFGRADIGSLMVEAGFPAAHVRTVYLPAMEGPLDWYVVTGSLPPRKSQRAP